MPSPGLYLTNATDETVPVHTEDGSGDTALLTEYLAENGFVVASRGHANVVKDVGAVYPRQTSAEHDKAEYVDERGIAIYDSEWDCPYCGDRGLRMFRPGSLPTCAHCFWVVGGQYNDYRLQDWDLRYIQAQALLAERGDDWHGTPGSVATRLRAHFDTAEEAREAFSEEVLGR